MFLPPFQFGRIPQLFEQVLEVGIFWSIRMGGPITGGFGKVASVALVGVKVKFTLGQFQIRIVNVIIKGRIKGRPGGCAVVQSERLGILEQVGSHGHF